MYLLLRATSLPKPGAAKGKMINDIMREDRGTLKRLNWIQAGLG
jgi:hypothetical protein